MCVYRDMSVRSLLMFELYCNLKKIKGLDIYLKDLGLISKLNDVHICDGSSV